jgi:hypothetical protein
MDQVKCEECGRIGSRDEFIELGMVSSETGKDEARVMLCRRCAGPVTRMIQQTFGNAPVEAESQRRKEVLEQACSDVVRFRLR